MRALLPIAVCLALTACNRDEAASNQTAVDTSLDADDIVANDITAIDAATNDAANMAEDMDVAADANLLMNLPEADGNAVEERPARSTSRRSTSRAATRRPASPAPTREEPAETASNETAD